MTCLMAFSIRYATYSHTFFFFLKDIVKWDFFTKDYSKTQLVFVRCVCIGKTECPFCQLILLLRSLVRGIWPMEGHSREMFIPAVHSLFVFSSCY